MKPWPMPFKWVPGNAVGNLACTVIDLDTDAQPHLAASLDMLVRELRIFFSFGPYNPGPGHHMGYIIIHLIVFERRLYHLPLTVAVLTELLERFATCSCSNRLTWRSRKLLPR